MRHADDEAKPGGERPRAIAGNYFQAAGIVVVAWGAWVAVLEMAARVGAVDPDSPWLPGLLGLAAAYGVYRAFQRYRLCPRHLVPIALVVGVVGLLIAIS